MRIHTRWIDARLDMLCLDDTPGAEPQLWRAAAACLYLLEGRMAGSTNAWQRRDLFTGWRLGLGSPEATAGQRVSLSAAEGPSEELRISPVGPDGAFTVIAADGGITEIRLNELRPGGWLAVRSEERRVGKDGVSPFRSGWV